MTKSKKRIVVITRRDHALFTFLFKFKTASLQDIYEELFKGVHYSAVNRRLRILLLSKYIEKSVIFTDVGRTTSIFHLLPKGLKELQKSGVIVTKNQLKSNYPEHDLKLLRLMKKISSLNMVDEVILKNELVCLELYQKDEVLSNLLPLRPDAVCKLKVKGYTFLVAMEFEQNKKSHERLKQKLLNYYQCGAVDAVFYFCESEEILRAIAKIDQQIATTEKRKVYFALSGELTLTNSSGNTFTLN